MHARKKTAIALPLLTAVLIGCATTLTDARPQTPLAAQREGATRTYGVDEPDSADAANAVTGQSQISRTSGWGWTQTLAGTTWGPTTVTAHAVIHVNWSGGGVTDSAKCNASFAHSCTSPSTTFTPRTCVSAGDHVTASISGDHAAYWILSEGHSGSYDHDDCSIDDYYSGGSGGQQLQPESGQCYEWYHYNGWAWQDMGEYCY